MLFQFQIYQILLGSFDYFFSVRRWSEVLKDLRAAPGSPPPPSTEPTGFPRGNPYEHLQDFSCHGGTGSPFEEPIVPWPRWLYSATVGSCPGFRVTWEAQWKFSRAVMSAWDLMQASCAYTDFSTSRSREIRHDSFLLFEHREQHPRLRAFLWELMRVEFMGEECFLTREQCVDAIEDYVLDICYLEVVPVRTAWHFYVYTDATAMIVFTTPFPPQTVQEIMQKSGLEGADHGITLCTTLFGNL